MQMLSDSYQNSVAQALATLRGEHRNFAPGEVWLVDQRLRLLRLKGGGLFVFGRGAGEILALDAAGIPFRVDPGVTASLGAVASNPCAS